MKRGPCFWLILVLALALVADGLEPATASVQVPQTPIAGNSLTKYLDPLPFFGPGGAAPPEFKETSL